MKATVLRPFRGHQVGDVLEVNPATSQVRSLLSQGKLALLVDEPTPEPTPKRGRPPKTED